ncbi:MAG: hypothetical protein ACREFP_08920 [Acetobacteraceae bacterium]
MARVSVQAIEAECLCEHAPALDSLERSQLTQYAERPLPRQRVRRGTLVLLVALRIYVLIAIPVVAYAFFRAVLGH